MKLQQCINQYKKNFNEIDEYIWDYIKNNLNIAQNLTIEEMGTKCLVSRSTILRFCKKIGLSGYSELKYMLKDEVEQTYYEFGNSINIIELFEHHANLIKKIESRDYQLFCQIISRSNRIFVVSSGLLQISVATELKRLFLKLGIILDTFSGSTEIDFLKNTLKPDDCIISISISGENEDIIQLLSYAKNHQIETISITNSQTNSIAKLASDSIHILNNPYSISKFGYPYISTTLYFALAEILFINYYNFIHQN